MPSAGVVIAKVPSAQLKQALEARAGAFVIYEPSRGWIGPDDNCIGEHCGSAYVCDGELALAIGASPDLLTNLSGELNTTVIACGYETVSGTYRFFAAERGKLLRYLSTSTSRRKPFTMGSPLPSEVHAPLHAVEGVLAASRKRLYHGCFVTTAGRRLSMMEPLPSLAMPLSVLFGIVEPNLRARLMPSENIESEARDGVYDPGQLAARSHRPAVASW